MELRAKYLHNLPLNHNEPRIMHVDLNSAFATIEQQANPLYRGKPLVVAAYVTPNGCVLAPSIEAKKMGVKTGMTVRDARLLCPGVIVRMSDPDRYFPIQQQFKKIFSDYSPEVTMKSIDEGVIDCTHTLALHRKTMEEIGVEIKKRFREEIGEWMQCSIGISTNRFLAKLGASLHKPDGLDTITHENVLEIYKSIRLIDLNGINVRYQARLNAAGIFTALDFLHAPLEKLKHDVFQSINGMYWYLRLRGWEIDAVDFDRKSYGNDYALKKKTNDPREIARLLMKLCEKTGRRLRHAGYQAHGVHVACVFEDLSHFHIGRKYEIPVYSTKEIYIKALRLLNRCGFNKRISKLSVSVYDLISGKQEQMSIFSNSTHELTKTMDAINNKYGEYMITPALMMGMEDVIVKRVAFGGISEVSDLPEIYS